MSRSECRRSKCPDANVRVLLRSRSFSLWYLFSDLSQTEWIYQNPRLFCHSLRWQPPTLCLHIHRSIPASFLSKHFDHRFGACLQSSRQSKEAHEQKAVHHAHAIRHHPHPSIGGSLPRNQCALSTLWDFPNHSGFGRNCVVPIYVCLCYFAFIFQYHHHDFLNSPLSTNNTQFILCRSQTTPKCFYYSRFNGWKSTLLE